MDVMLSVSTFCPFALRLINEHRIVKKQGMQPLPIQGVPVDMDTARQLVHTDRLQVPRLGDLLDRRLRCQPTESWR